MVGCGGGQEEEEKPVYIAPLSRRNLRCWWSRCFAGCWQRERKRENESKRERDRERKKERERESL